jgi:hypothetical protein
MSNEEVYQVIKQHICNYPNPIKLNKGQSVIVGEKYCGPEGWNKWVYCHTLDNTLEGWVPEQIIDNKAEKGQILEDYIAKELDIELNEKVVIQKELNGWAWVKRLETSEEGWVPKVNLMRMQEF